MPSRQPAPARTGPNVRRDTRRGLLASPHPPMHHTTLQSSQPVATKLIFGTCISNGRGREQPPKARQAYQRGLKQLSHNKRPQTPIETNRTGPPLRLLQTQGRRLRLDVKRKREVEPRLICRSIQKRSIPRLKRRGFMHENDISHPTSHFASSATWEI